MNLPKEFEYYLNQGIIKKCIINKSRAKFLIEESEKSAKGLYKRIEMMNIDEYNANSMVKDCYDIIMSLIRAKLLLTGYCSAGQFAHEAEISYLKKFGFPDNEISFINDLRYFRNSVNYYGKILNIEYAQQVIDFTKKMHTKLINMIEDNLELNEKTKKETEKARKEIKAGKVISQEEAEKRYNNYSKNKL